MRPPSTLLGLSGLVATAHADPTWPSPVDELEEVIFQLTSFGSRHFADVVSPCTNQASGPGRLNAAEWLRTAFHDMSTGSTFFGTGGLDASLQYELDNGENTGPGHRTTLEFMAPYVSSRSSLSDLLAAGVYLSVRSCGGPIVPVRVGRKDATAKGSTGVPQPQNSVLTFQQQFQRMGFSNEEMIQVTACGHTIGGVHENEFPDIVAPGSTADGMASLDSSQAAFDNRVVTEYLDGNTKNPLVVGPAVRVNKHADFKVFSSDGNATMRKLADADEFRETCRVVLQKMIDLVPDGVELTQPIEPYTVKPVDMQLTLTKGGTALELSGFIRVKVPKDGGRVIESVTIEYKDRAGDPCRADSCRVRITSSELGKGFDDSFAFFPVKTTISAMSGISSFTVVVKNEEDDGKTFDNNGEGYPMQDSVIFQTPQSCLDESSGDLTIVAAVLDSLADEAVEAIISYKAQQKRSPIPNLKTAKIALKKGDCVGQYTLFTASFTIEGPKPVEATLDIMGSGGQLDSFKRAAKVGGTCRAFSSPAKCGDETPPPDEEPTTTTARSPESSLTTSTHEESRTFTSAEPTSGPRHRDVVGDYAFVSCWTEGSGVRALSASMLADDGMTLEMCMEFCSEYLHWGTEYGRECWCGDALAESSQEAPLKDCNMLCAGDRDQYCGAGDRLELYSKT